MAAVEFGAAVVSAFLQVAFDKLASAEIGDYFRGRKLNEKLLKKLNITLLSINAVVDDAEQKQIRNPHVRAWLHAVKDAVYEAEDMLDEIDIQVSKCKLEAESQSTTSSKVWTFFNASVISSFDKEIESKMQEVLDNLEHLESKMDILGLKEASSGFGVGSGRQVSQKLPSTSLPVESVIYGRDDDKEIILNWLISDTENDSLPLSIISIVGMGGMGKTTLAQHLYNDPRMEEGKFDFKAWVCVSEEFDVCRVTRAILVAITNSTNDSADMNMLQVKLKEKLSGKRFLLVLDDVWNENRMQWEALQTPFNYGAQGSKVLVTTRSKKVASTMRSNKIRQLDQLEEEHCWQLFAKHAFRDESSQINPDFKEVGKKVIKKCQGLPLALKAVGSLLYTKSSLVEWESILASEIWDLPEEENNIIPALILSYHHLPSHLKRCFAYCALFPKDYVFEKEHLILLWMAENFLQCPPQSKSTIEVGEQYFNDLLLRSFFQQSRELKICFVMHDLLNDLAKYVCGDFCVTLKAEEEQKVLKMSRHFSFISNRREASKRFEILCNADRLRTFLLLCMTRPDEIQWLRTMPSTWMQEFFSKFKLLRVFSLYGYFKVFELPDTIGDLKHLRYLDLSLTGIVKLPDSLCFLYNLQILKLMCCWCLEELPLNLHKLTNLCYLDVRGTRVRKLPMDVGKLKNLQVLSSFYVGKGSEANINQLGELNLHGTLSISELQNIVNPLDALAANLKNKVHLVKLVLEWNANNDNSQKEREVLEKLQPSKHLKELSIKSYGGTLFPGWFGDNSLSNVGYLTLSNCESCVLLPPLGFLPSLKELLITGLSGIVVIGSEFYGNGSSSSSVIPFASLETLEFKDMEGWEEWECKTAMGAFPRLQKLSIENCPNLKGHLPEKLTCLVTLKISNCRQLVASIPWAPTIHELYPANCGKLQFDYHPSTLKILKIYRCCMEGSSLEWIGHTLPDLKSLVIEDCPTMNIPLCRCYNFLVDLKITSSCDSLRTFPLDFFPNLLSLKMQKCSNLEMISQEHGHNHSLIFYLSISECPKFVSLPERMHILLPSLLWLTIDDCPQLESFPDGGLPSNLQNLDLKKCSKHLIASLKWALGTNSCLKVLMITNLDVESFPDQGLLPLSLTSLFIVGCLNLKKLDYKSLYNSCLTHLAIEKMDVESFPNQGLLPLSLTSLVISDCLNLKKLDYKGLYNSCLKHLTIREVDVESFPDQGLLPLSLTSLSIRGCLNLKKLDYKGLCHLSLTELSLYNCPNLEGFPVEGLPKSISTLKFHGNCLLLKQRYWKPKGEDWGKISHIESVEIGDDF